MDKIRRQKDPDVSPRRVLGCWAAEEGSVGLLVCPNRIAGLWGLPTPPLPCKWDGPLERPLGCLSSFSSSGQQKESSCLKSSTQPLIDPLGRGVCAKVPLHGTLPKEQQLKAFVTPARGNRKVVVATNLAEASVTIDGIVYVVDSCLVKLDAFCPFNGTSYLNITACSKGSARQRCGRAGRTRAGHCFRLLTESAYHQLHEHTLPEVQRSDLKDVVLTLKCLGVDDVGAFEFPTPPARKALEVALEDLYALGAIDAEARLVEPLGLRMAHGPLPAPLMRLLLLSVEEPHRCAAEASIACAMLTMQPPWLPSQNKDRLLNCKESFAVYEGDLVSVLNIYRQYEVYREKDPEWAKRHLLNAKLLDRAMKVKQQLGMYLAKFNLPEESCGSEVERLQRVACASLFLNSARRLPNGTYRLCGEALTDYAAVYAQAAAVDSAELGEKLTELLQEQTRCVRHVLRPLRAVSLQLRDLGSFLRHLLHLLRILCIYVKLTPLYTTISCQQAKLPELRNFHLGLPLVSPTTFDIIVQMNCTNPNPYSIGFDWIEMGGVFLGKSMTKVGDTSGVPGKTSFFPADGFGSIWVRANTTVNALLITELLGDVLTSGGELPLKLQLRQRLHVDVSLMAGIGKSVSQLFEKECGMMIANLGLRPNIGPMACADSFDQLAIPPVGADVFDGTMRSSGRRWRGDVRLREGLEDLQTGWRWLLGETGGAQEDSGGHGLEKLELGHLHGGLLHLGTGALHHGGLSVLVGLPGQRPEGQAPGDGLLVRVQL
ncbi:unnamed protein product [Durusdinium trenchii]|uniref:Helicase C-terminal domain-containing protein n=1 Tax=Durusdinium trenchii TaxID=1381693 RepID=A0ABP0MT64_9DINO